MTTKPKMTSGSGASKPFSNLDNRGIDDHDDDSIIQYHGTKGGGASSSPAPSPCPFKSPNITGRKNRSLYPDKAYEGLTLLRPYKMSQSSRRPFLVAFPLCYPNSTQGFIDRLYTIGQTPGREPDMANGCGNVQNPLTTNLTYLTDIPPKNAECFLLDPDWTKAIFIRDPKVRVLSAYLNQVVEKTEYIKARCCDQKSDAVHVLLEFHDPKTLPIISFDDFLTAVVPHCTDGHWFHQSDLLRDVQWEQVNFVGHFDRLEEDTRRLLDDVLGVWDEMGATGWPDGSLYAGSSTVVHQTGAHDRMRHYYTKELEVFADKWYKKDYESPYLGLTKYKLFG